jgi:hypothetical protein
MFIFFEAKISKHLLQNEINVYRKKQYLYKGGQPAAPQCRTERCHSQRNAVTPGRDAQLCVSATTKLPYKPNFCLSLFVVVFNQSSTTSDWQCV